MNQIHHSIKRGHLVDFLRKRKKKARKGGRRREGREVPEQNKDCRRHDRAGR
jgi:hypothetical protein